tara:strand:+ start:1233 stop:1499 length:267 start_codon:yes stop_codon:yes gene_type:complete
MEEFNKELARIQRDSFIETQIELYANYLPKRLKEIQKESEKLDWRDRNTYEAGCLKVLLEAAIEQLEAVNKNLKERRDEYNKSITERD